VSSGVARVQLEGALAFPLCFQPVPVVVELQEGKRGVGSRSVTHTELRGPGLGTAFRATSTIVEVRFRPFHQPITRPSMSCFCVIGSN
jgi:hypothetical protein